MNRKTDGAAILINGTTLLAGGVACANPGAIRMSNANRDGNRTSLELAAMEW